MRGIPNRPVLYLATTILLAAWSPLASAQWVRGGLGLCTERWVQFDPKSVSDGAGGAIVAWQDDRDGSQHPNIYVQRVDSHGVVQWTEDGIALFANSRYFTNLVIAPDGAGGAVCSWQEPGNDWDIIAQGVDASGNLKWPSEIPVCNHPSSQEQPSITSDGAGGAIIAWMDSRGGSRDIYAQRVSPTGAAFWALDGIAVCTAVSDQQSPIITTDVAGGAIIAWEDGRTSKDDVYVQRVSASGALLWAVDGVDVCDVVVHLQEPVIASDGSGGAIIGWTHYAVPNGYDIHAQRVDASGTRLWSALGLGISGAPRAQIGPRIIADGSGGAIFAWEDARDGPAMDIYAQRVDASGAKLWPLRGVAVCSEVGSQWHPELAGDGSGGAILTWLDTRFGIGCECYAQHVDATGIARWPEGGTDLGAVDTIASRRVTIASGTPNTAIVSWPDRRPIIMDIYAQRAADPEPGSAYCFGDVGSGTPCPCNNDNDGSVLGSGCANGSFASGAQLTASGEASLGGDTLVLAVTSTVPIQSGLYFQGDNDLGPGSVWGDGLRCAGGDLRRLRVEQANDRGDSATTLGISASAGNVQPGDTKCYQLLYRDPSGSPCGWRYNTTNAYAVTWGP